jgi:hypothetical protein
MKSKKFQNIRLSVELIVLLVILSFVILKFVSNRNMAIYFESNPEEVKVFSHRKFIGTAPLQIKYNIFNSKYFTEKTSFTFRKDFYMAKTIFFSYDQTKPIDTIKVNLKVSKEPLQEYSGEFSHNHLLPLEDLRDKTKEELAFIRNEIYAKYGREFITPKYRNYFNSKEWYKVNPHFSDDFLNETDKKNVALILSLEKSPKTSKTSAEKATDKPEYTYKEIEVELYPDKILIPEDLVCKTNEELALLRNEIYARHGRQFKTPKYQEYFNSKNWYKINPEYSDALLTETDRANLSLILDIEKSIEENKDMIKRILENPEYTYKNEKLIFIDEHNVKYLKSSNWGRIFCKYDYISSTGEGEKIVRWRSYKGEIFLCDYNKVWGKERRQISIVKLDLKDHTIRLIKRIEEKPEYYY